MPRPDIEAIERAAELAKMHPPEAQAQYLSRCMVNDLIVYIQELEREHKGDGYNVIHAHVYPTRIRSPLVLPDEYYESGDDIEEMEVGT